MMTTPLEYRAMREAVECFKCRQLVAWRLSSGTLVSVGVMLHEDNRGDVRTECPRCGHRITIRQRAA
jgi:DNA-directed RNA polymerase subunit RPC12/RpoP